jgi:hypothetical protein
MSDGKKWAAGGVAAAILGLLVGIPALFHHPEPGALEQRVAQLQADDQAESASARHHDVAARIETLEAITHDPEFDSLPGPQADFVQGRLEELRAYAAYAKEADQLPDPAEAEDRGQLDAMRRRIDRIHVPSEYEAEWAKTEAGRKYAASLAEAKALAAAADRLRDGYRKLTADGEAVLKDTNGPDLPGRAQAVLVRAKQLPRPETDRGKRIPGADHATYTTGFRFDDVKQAYAAWEPVRTILERAAALAMP